MITMRVLETIKEVENEGWLALIGKKVFIQAGNYFYVGKLVGVNGSLVKLTDASLVFETGNYGDKTWKTAQKLPNDIYINTNWVEAFMESWVN
jgi:hypothetical protein